jgi:8-oxo-dGTP pyrophosphatase MutT (NUDIX family)
MTIYLNDRIILLKKRKPEGNDCHFAGSLQELSLLYHAFEADPTRKRLILYGNEYQKLKEDFLSLFTIVIAAGGYVENEKKEILFIFRRGHWDLPKGKLSKKNGSPEKKTAAALREVMEETGIERIDIVGKKAKTYHIFFDKRVRYLKKTHWYEMRAPKDQPLKPQAEEDITEVKWISRTDFGKVRELLYPSLEKLLRD